MWGFNGVVTLNRIEQNAETLSSFGLTIKQAKVYLALVSTGISTVGELSKLSKVRREEVYRILPKLEKLGLIEKTLTAPVKLKATSIDNALSLLIRAEEERTKNRLIELRNKKEEFLKNYRTSSKEGRLGEGEQFSIISEKAVGLGKIETLIDNAKLAIDYCVSREKLVQFLKFFSKSLTEAIKRGVKIRILSKSPENRDDITKVFNQNFFSVQSITMRYLDNLPSYFLIIDKNEVLIDTNTSGYLVDNPLLWSNNLPHVMSYKKLFEELWTSTVESATLTNKTDDEKLKTFIKQMKPSDHVILLYETSEAKNKVLLSYAKFALENNEAFIYICSEASVEEIKVAMIEKGIDVNRYEKSAALRILDYTQHYVIDGQFNINNTLKLWDKYYSEAIAKGFQGLRVTGETSCFFKHNLVNELIDYEKALHRILDTPMIAICAYRADQIMNPNNSTNIYPELVKAHGSVLFTWVDPELGRVAIS